MTEPFPPLHTAAPASVGAGIARRRRKSSGLGADLPGDVDVPSFATSTRLDAANLRSPADVVGQILHCTLVLSSHAQLCRLSSTTPPTDPARSQISPAAPNAGLSVAASPSSSVPAYGTHGYSRSSCSSPLSPSISSIRTRPIPSPPVCFYRTHCRAMTPSSPPLSAPTPARPPTTARARATLPLSPSTSSC